MKARVNFRALCPYEVKEDGTELFHWYTEEYEVDEIKSTETGIVLHTPANGCWQSFAHEQINILTIAE